VAVQAEARIVAHLHFQQQVAGRSALHARLALPCKTNDAPGQDAGGNVHFQRALAVRVPEAESLLAAGMGGRKIDLHGGAHIAPAHRSAWRARTLAKQRFEEIAEVSAAEATAIAEFKAAMLLLRPVRRRAELVATAIAASAQVVIGRALLLVAQYLMGFVDGFELLLGAGFLADVRVILARELAIRGLYLRLVRIGLYAQGFVVVLEFHPVIPKRKPAANRSAAGLILRERRGLHSPGLISILRGVV